MRRGEVWWYENPEEPPRPWVILTRDEAIGGLKKVLATPTTRTIRGIQTEVRIGRDDGMPQECTVSLDNTAPILKALLIERINTLGPEKMDEVCRTLAYATSCSTP